ncbi:hypothetical protein HanRHA438_Chr04g0177761 [Helianthus annuus]|nr:hypothetical protein HanRHA438_Chr04g0177761 [Helianthus annuus]
MLKHKGLKYAWKHLGCRFIWSYGRVIRLVTMKLERTRKRSKLHDERYFCIPITKIKYFNDYKISFMSGYVQNIRYERKCKLMQFLTLLVPIDQISAFSHTEAFKDYF